MNVKEYLLTQAASECNEVAHRITKAMQFGMDEVQEGQGQTNAERIVSEFYDLIAAMQMLQDRGLIKVDREQMDKAIKAKIAKVNHYMKFAEQCKTLEPENEQ